MIEPRAWEIEDGNGVAIARLARHIDINRVVAVKKTPLVTVADVLAALRQPSAAMIEAGLGAYIRPTGILAKDRMLYAIRAMLDQFEKEQKI